MSALLAALFVLLAVDAAPVDARDKDLARAEAAYRMLYYDAAAQALEAVLSDETSTAKQRLAAHRLFGVIEVVRGNNDDAQAHFVAMLDIDRTATLSGEESPKITAFWDWVRFEYEKTHPAEPSGAATATTGPPSTPLAAASAAKGDAAIEDGNLEGKGGIEPWVIAGLMVGAGALGLAVGTALGVGTTAVVMSTPPPSGSLGTVQLP